MSSQGDLLRRIRALLASASICALAGTARAQDAGAVHEVSARVALTGDKGEREWTDVHVDAEDDAALDRCRRIVQSLVRAHSSPLSTARILRDCGPEALPTRTPAVEPTLLRTARALSAPALFALGQPGASGRIVTTVQMESAEACRLALDSEDAPRPGAQERQPTLAADQICDEAAKAEEKILRTRRRLTSSRKTKVELTRMRCKKAWGSSAGTTGDHSGELERACVRE